MGVNTTLKVNIRGHEFTVVDSPETRAWEFWEKVETGHWESGTYDVLDEYLDGRWFVDIGAWIGPLSIYAARRGPVRAFEPDPVAFTELTANVADLPVERWQCAVAETERAGYLKANPNGHFGDSMSRLGDEGVQVTTCSPASALDGIDVCLVKIDVEGGEVLSLPTLAPLCAERGIPLHVSWHEDWWPVRYSDAERRKWFAGFGRIEGSWNGYDTMLAIP